MPSSSGTLDDDDRKIYPQTPQFGDAAQPRRTRHVDEGDVGIVQHELRRGAGRTDDVERRLGPQ